VGIEENKESEKMNRRDFSKTALMVAAAGAVTPSVAVETVNEVGRTKEQSRAYLWAILTSHPSCRLKGCRCHQSFPSGHPMGHVEYMDPAIYGEVGTFYVEWNSKCPWHGHGQSGSHVDDKVWYDAWIEKMKEHPKSANLEAA
jgi:hypothetical protein